MGHIEEDGLTFPVPDEASLSVGGQSWRGSELKVDLPPGAIERATPPTAGSSVAFVDGSNIVFYGVLGRCGVCDCPAVFPMPDGWTMQLIVGDGRVRELIPHQPDCAGPKGQIVLPGQAIHSVEIG